MKLSVGATYWLVLAVTTSCGPSSISPSEGGTNSSNDGHSIEEIQAQSLESVDREACDAKGGDVRQAGMMGLWRCVTPYSDASKICADISDCEGMCLSADDVTDNEALVGEVKGRCQVNDNPFGCYAEIRHGVIDATLCVD